MVGGEESEIGVGLLLGGHGRFLWSLKSGVFGRVGGYVVYSGEDRVQCFGSWRP